MRRQDRRAVCPRDACKPRFEPASHAWAAASALRATPGNARPTAGVFLFCRATPSSTAGGTPQREDRSRRRRKNRLSKGTLTTRPTFVLRVGHFPFAFLPPTPWETAASRTDSLRAVGAVHLAMVSSPPTAPLPVDGTLPPSAPDHDLTGVCQASASPAGRGQGNRLRRSVAGYMSRSVRSVTSRKGCRPATRP